MKNKLWINSKPGNIEDLDDIFIQRDARVLREVLENPYSACSVYEDGNLKGALLLSYDEYDSGFFGARIGKIAYYGGEVSPEGYGHLFQPLLTEASREGYSYLFFKIPGVFSSTKEAAESHGFTPCGTNVDLSLDLKNSEPEEAPSFGHKVRVAGKEDEENLKAIAECAFRRSRFYNVDFIDQAAADRYHGEWIMNLMKDENSTVFAVEESGEVAGFLAIKTGTDRKTGRIILVAIDEKKRRKGLGQSLLRHAIDWSRDKVDTLYVKTQEDNIPAIRFYERNGFRMFEREIGYHKTLVK
jgi:ribosomal protein S18 acetylase RimI-like enzyme